MNFISQLALMLALVSLTALPACARPTEPAAGQAQATSTIAMPTPAVQTEDVRREAPASVDAALLPVVAYKNPGCSCCELWADHLRKAGFQVEVRETDKLNEMKVRVGVPSDKVACHTAQVGDYFVEGHVPASDIKRLLAEKPDARGLVVPGMPLGSPGMETPDGATQVYTVELVDNSGTTTVFAEH